jgi:hypothetical protein
MRKTVLSLLLGMLTLPAFCCTSIIISGKATADGRPLMLKHRDTGKLDNAVGYFRGPRFSFIGLVNASTAFDGEVWTGTNEAGFSIMNTASYNIKDDDVPASEMDREGIIMYKALGICGNLPDFEHLLDTLPRPLGVEANFGVIDACGGAAYYEVNNYSWVKYDVNALESGYRVVTNFSESGRREDYKGYERYITATEIFSEILSKKPYKVKHGDLFDCVSRSYRNRERGKAYVIPRNITSASLVIEGVRPGENPLHTVMWTILGYPPCSVAVPLLVGNGCLLPAYVMPGDDGHSELCDLALKMKEMDADLRPQCRRAEDKIDAMFLKIFGKWTSGDLSDNLFFRKYASLRSSFLRIYKEEFGKND